MSFSLNSCYLFKPNANQSQRSVKSQVVLTFSTSKTILREEESRLIKKVLSQRLKYFQTLNPKHSFESYQVKTETNTFEIMMSEVNFDLDKLIKLLLKRGQFQLKIYDLENKIWLDTGINNQHIESITSFPAYSGNWAVSMTFTKATREKIAVLTSRYLNQKLGMFIDETLISAPIVRSPILSGKTQVDGLSKESVNALTMLIKYGSLPTQLEFVSVSTVSSD